LAGALKGLEMVGDHRIIDRVAAALQPVTAELLLVANNADASRWLPGVAVLSDLRPGAGGLAGVETALSRGSDVMVVAWDMPFVPSPLLQALLDAARANDADVGVPESESPYGFEPFCAYYSAKTLSSLSEFLREGGGATRDFLRRQSRVYRMPLAEVAIFGDPRRVFFSVNTPDDLTRARAMAAAH
jgi:molybdopterin-guanine dinucleotide biosynthesis protein A